MRLLTGIARRFMQSRLRAVAIAATGACLLTGGLSFVIVPDAVAAPTTLYAGVLASGSGDCSSVANACTLQTALSDAAAGDVVALVTSGIEGTPSTYYEGGNVLRTSGTSAYAPVVIEPAPGVTNPIIDGAGNEEGLLVYENLNIHLVINGVTFQHCSYGLGGAIFNGGVLTVNDSTFLDNHASGGIGGAISNGYLFTSTLTVNDSTFSGNTAAYSGGAIGNGEAYEGEGAGLGTLTVNNSTFTDNGAGDDGGAIDNGDYGSTASLTVTASTFAGNTANVDGATIDNGDNGGTGSIVAAADIFAGSCDQVAGSWTDVGYNVGSDTSCQNGGIGDAVSSTLADELGPLSNNGGPTQTMQLLAGNPAVGLIPQWVIPTGVGLLCPVSADQTGAPSTPGAPCNAGALQNHFAITTSSLSGATAGSSYGPVTLQTAGAEASTSPYTTTVSWYGAELPKGMALSSTGLLSGTPNAKLLAGSYSVVAEATETFTTITDTSTTSSKATVEATIPLTVSGAEASGGGFAITTSSLPGATAGSSYGPATLQTAGEGTSTSPYTTTVSWFGAELPKGMALSSTGVLSGTPGLKLLAGTCSVVAQATETVTTLNGRHPVKTKTTVDATIPLIINT